MQTYVTHWDLPDGCTVRCVDRVIGTVRRMNGVLKVFDGQGVFVRFIASYSCGTGELRDVDSGQVGHP